VEIEDSRFNLKSAMRRLSGLRRRLLNGHDALGVEVPVEGKRLDHVMLMYQPDGHGVPLAQ